MIVRKTNHLVRKGFSLMEIMVVVAIIMVLVGGGTYFYMKYQQDAHIAKATQSVRALSLAVESYKLKNNDYPADLSQLLQPDDSGHPYLDSDALRTPWGGQYNYDPNGPNNNGFKADIWVDSPNGKRIGNWAGAS